MTKQLKAWDAYLAEASVEPVMLPLPDGSALTINQPSFGALRRINEATRKGDIDAQLLNLCGPENAAKLNELFENAPSAAVEALLKDISTELGLTMSPGESSASLS